MTIRYLSLFSGVEAVSVAWGQLGWECAAVSEIEPFPCAVLAHHYPNVPNLGDVTKVTEADIKALGKIDIVVFGSPCQDLSVAGKRAGLKGERSGLFTTAMQIIKWSGCRFALLENVPGAFSSNKGDDFTTVVSEMAGLDGLVTPADGWAKEGAAVGDGGLLEWAVLDAQWFGLAQRRKRVFAIVDFGDWTSRPPILLERQSLRGDSAPSRETRQDTASNVRASIAARCFDKQRIGQYADNNIASTCAARDYKDATDLVVEPYQKVVGALCARDCKGVGNQYVAEGKLVVEKAVYSFDSLASNSMKSKNPHSGCRQVELAKCLDTSNGCPSKNQGSESVVVALAGNIIGRQPQHGGNQFGIDDSGACYTLTATDRHAVAYPINTMTCMGGEPSSVCSSLTADAGSGDSAPCVATELTVRRLTPLECERLQGFPDNYTKIAYRNKDADQCPNGPRYKAMGNSMAVPVMLYIGQKIKEAIEYAAA